MKIFGFTLNSFYVRVQVGSSLRALVVSVEALP